MLGPSLTEHAPTCKPASLTTHLPIIVLTLLQAGWSHLANLAKLASSYINSVLEVQQQQQQAAIGGDAEARPALCKHVY